MVTLCGDIEGFGVMVQWEEFSVFWHELIWIVQWSSLKRVLGFWKGEWEDTL